MHLSETYLPMINQAWLNTIRRKPLRPKPSKPGDPMASSPHQIIRVRLTKSLHAPNCFGSVAATTASYVLFFALTFLPAPTLTLPPALPRSPVRMPGR